MPSRDYFLKGREEKALKSYEEYVVNVAVAMGASRQRAESEIAQMIDFEILLANVSLQSYNTVLYESVRQLLLYTGWAKKLHIAISVSTLNQFS